jgi:uncharacterized protein YndB with AHSA1/START domain
MGGKFLYCMRSPDGKDYWNTSVYREIVERERIVSTDSFSGEALILIADTRVPPRISRRERRGTGPRLRLPARSGYVARAGHTGSW